MESSKVLQGELHEKQKMNIISVSTDTKGDKEMNTLMYRGASYRSSPKETSDKEKTLTYRGISHKMKKHDDKIFKNHVYRGIYRGLNHFVVKNKEV
jgi:hypothetical protein|tara:strand:- start:1719 stop:2006 length:288 start_codon:yes stop_codon:yes gene_type:complete